MSARVEIPAPGDLIMDANGNVRTGVAVSLTLASDRVGGVPGTGSAVTHYSALTGGTSTTGGLVSGSDGTIVDGSGNRRYIDSGIAADLTISGRTRQVEPMAAGVAAMASSYLRPTGGDDSAAMISALANFAPFVSPVIVLGPGLFLWNTTVPSLARSQPAKIIGSGTGRTTVKLSTTARRFMDFNKVADYDTFNDIEISDLTIDCDNVGGQHHVILGTYISGSTNPGIRINVARLGIRRVRTINVPTDSTVANHRLNIFIISQVNVADTRCTMTDIVLEDLDLNGGNIGVAIGGITNDGSGNGNLYHDRIELTRVNHDTGVPWSGATFSSENIQIGSKDSGGTVTIRDCHGYNSGDVGIAVLNGRYCHIEGCTVTDSRNAMFQAGNFNPVMPTDQTHTFRNCHAKVVNLNPAQTTFPATGFLGGGSPNQQLGHVVMDDCTFHTAATNAPPLGAAIDMQAPMQSLTITSKFHMDATAISHSLAANYVSGMVRFRPPGKCTLTVRGALRSNVSGSITRNGFTFLYKDIAIEPPANADYTIDAEDHLPKISISGLAAGSCYGSYFGDTSIPSNTTVTGTTTNLSASVTGLSAADILKVTPGDPVTGTNIPANQTVKSVDSVARSFVFGPSTASGSGSVTITVTPLACLRGRWRFDWQGDDSGDTAPIGAFVQKWGTPGRAPIASAFFALSGRLSFDYSNASRMPSGSAGNGNVLGSEISDTGNAANAMPLVTYRGIRPANALQKGAMSTFALSAGSTTITNSLGRPYQVWLSVAPSAITFARGTDVTPQAAIASNGPFYMEPGDVVVVTSAAGSWYRIPADH